MKRTRRATRRGSAGALRIAGFSLPPIDAILFTGAGLVVPPMVTKLIMDRLPANLQGSKPVYYGVKAASVLIPSMLVKRFVSQRAGNLLLLGGAASFAIDLLKETGVLSSLGIGAQPMLGLYPSVQRGLSGMGRYASLPIERLPVGRAQMLSNVPDRLSPDGRF